ncbi:hypothetical protein [Amycolatopsis jejuensis]|uniref:hypothetical protein n=1 Tax=Amycolatopsis jejuensis TaxID=330084 RepID=UPI000A80B5BE|nr:hypothetical protein [Amycolatopsis jejuensis]
METSRHNRPSPSATADGRPAVAGGGTLADLGRLIDRADALHLRAPELSLVLGERAAALAETAGADGHWIRAEALVVAARVRTGARTSTVGRAVAALRAAEHAGYATTAARLRIDLAVCARSLGVPLLGLAALRPVLSEHVPPSLRAEALCHLVGCLAQFGRKAELDRVLVEADRLLVADDSLDADDRLLMRALLRNGTAAHRRRHGDLTAAADAARTGLGFLDKLHRPGDDGGLVRIRLVLQLVSTLLDRGDADMAYDIAEPILREPVRAAGIAPSAWLRLAVATRIHLPAGAGDAAAELVGEAVAATDRHGLAAVTARLWLELAQIEERFGSAEEAIACLHRARAAEHVHARARRQACGLIAGELGTDAVASLDLDDVLAASAPRDGRAVSMAVEPRVDAAVTSVMPIIRDDAPAPESPAKDRKPAWSFGTGGAQPDETSVIPAVREKPSEPGHGGGRRRAEDRHPSALPGWVRPFSRKDAETRDQPEDAPTQRAASWQTEETSGRTSGTRSAHRADSSQSAGEPLARRADSSRSAAESSARRGDSSQSAGEPLAHRADSSHSAEGSLARGVDRSLSAGETFPRRANVSRAADDFSPHAEASRGTDDASRQSAVFGAAEARSRTTDDPSLGSGSSRSAEEARRSEALRAAEDASRWVEASRAAVEARRAEAARSDATSRTTDGSLTAGKASRWAEATQAVGDAHRAESSRTMGETSDRPRDDRPGRRSAEEMTTRHTGASIAAGENVNGRAANATHRTDVSPGAGASATRRADASAGAKDTTYRAATENATHRADAAVAAEGNATRRVDGSFAAEGNATHRADGSFAAEGNATRRVDGSFAAEENAAPRRDGTAEMPDARRGEGARRAVEKASSPAEEPAAPRFSLRMPDLSDILPELPLAPASADEAAAPLWESAEWAQEEVARRESRGRTTRHDAEHGSVAAKSVLDRLGITATGGGGGRRRADDAGRRARDPEPDEPVATESAAAETETADKPDPAARPEESSAGEPWLPRLRMPPALDPLADIDDWTPSEQPFPDSYARAIAEDEPPPDAGLAELLARALAEHQAGTASAAALVKRLGPDDEPKKPVNGRATADRRHNGD